MIARGTKHSKVTLAWAHEDIKDNGEMDILTKKEGPNPFINV